MTDTKSDHERRPALSELIARLHAQPHQAPCLLFYGPDRHPGAECLCWQARAIEFLEAEAALPASSEGAHGPQHAKHCIFWRVRHQWNGQAPEPCSCAAEGAHGWQDCPREGETI
jgi:hypothetical protein